jgi:hypothetical protein
MRASSIATRAGYVDAQATLIRASLIAAHSANAAGFRAAEVRFYFRLFANWLEQDVLRPSLDLELTQIRRALQSLERAGHCTGLRARRYRLNEAGLLELVEKLVDEVGIGFEEVLFVLLIAASYRDILRARVHGAVVPISSPARRRMGIALDPARIAKRAVRNAERLVSDLEQRIAADRSLESQLGQMKREGLSTTQIVERLTDAGAYQLQRIRPLAQLLLQLPEDLRAAELSAGIATRRAILFVPLLARAREELTQLRRLAQGR